jgi:hypothetical protein
MSKYGHSHGSHHRSSGGSGGSAGCIAGIVIAVLVIGFLGWGGKELFGVLFEGLSWDGLPPHSHDPLSATATCREWTAEQGTAGQAQQSQFMSAHIVGQDPDSTNLTAYCVSNPGEPLLTAVVGHVTIYALTSVGYTGNVYDTELRPVVAAQVTTEDLTGHSGQPTLTTSSTCAAWIINAYGEGKLDFLAAHIAYKGSETPDVNDYPDLDNYCAVNPNTLLMSALVGRVLIWDGVASDGPQQSRPVTPSDIRP